MTIKTGVPQGSILQPLMFILFINDLPMSMENNADMYADDSSVSAQAKTIPELEDKLNSDAQNKSNCFIYEVRSGKRGLREKLQIFQKIDYKIGQNITMYVGKIPLHHNIIAMYRKSSTCIYDISLLRPIWLPWQQGQFWNVFQTME